MIYLTYWEDMSGPELAEVLGISPATVRTRLHRAREAMRTALEKLREGNPGATDVEASVTALGTHFAS